MNVRTVSSINAPNKVIPEPSTTPKELVPNPVTLIISEPLKVNCLNTTYNNAAPNIAPIKWDTI